MLGRALVVVLVLGATEVAAAQGPFQVDAPEPQTFTIVGIDLAGGWGHSIVELDLRWMLLTRAGFMMDVRAGGSWGLAEPGWGVHTDAIVGWAFSWKSGVSDAITTAELHAQFANVRVDAYRYLSGVVPARGHFAIIGGVKTSILRGVFENPFEEDTNLYYMRIAGGIELGKVWGSWASRNGYRQFLWGYSGFRAMFLYSPQEAYEENSDEKLSRFGAALQWIQTTRLGRSRSIFGATIGLEPGAGWLLHANLTWPLYVGSFQ
ncbi:MAG: hypothetical protein JJ863_17940 [Deltaproteobacteria bacterium]|nr:hypothetical protein [Deltaproteobacteria bacterium]